METVREYITRISDSACIEMHDEYAEFERTGILRDGALRAHADAYIALSEGMSSTRLLIAMQIMSEVWRRFAVNTNDKLVVPGIEPEPFQLRVIERIVTNALRAQSLDILNAESNRAEMNTQQHSDLHDVLYGVQNGKMITAIKALRSLTRCGLKDGKHAYERLVQSVVK